jgi:hypothetical protein
MRTVELRSTTKSALRALIESEDQRVGSRTVAFENVARMIGASSSWIRKFITYEDAVAAPRMPLFENIRAAYNNICDRIEADNRTDEQRLRDLRDKMNEVDTSFSAESLPQGQIDLGEGE